jgi:hypothetical protein
VQRLRRRAPGGGRRLHTRRGEASTTHLAVIAQGAKAVADATQATMAARRSISLKVRVSEATSVLGSRFTHKEGRIGLGNKFLQEIVLSLIPILAEQRNMSWPSKEQSLPRMCQNL